MTTTQLDVTLTPAPAVRVLARLGTDTRYVLTGFPQAIAAVVVCVTGFSAGLGLAVVWLGVPILFAALMMARGFADAERERIAPVLGQTIPKPLYRTAEAPSYPRRFLAVLLDPQTWRDLAHATLRFVPSTIAFSVVVTWWAGVLGGASWSLWGWALPDGPDNRNLPELLGLSDSYGTSVAFYLVVAALFLVTLPTVVRAAARFEARFAASLLTAGK